MALESNLRAFVAQQENANTRQSYANALARYESWLGQKSYWSAGVTDDDARAYRAHLEGSGLSVATVAHRLAVVSAFYAWLGGPNPFYGARPTQWPMHVVRSEYLDADTVQRLVDAPTKIERPQKTSVRDQALMRVMADHPITAAEVAALDVGDVRITSRDQRILVRDPAVWNGYRAMPLSTRAASFLADWLEARPAWRKSQDSLGDSPLFVSRRDGLRLTRQGVWVIVRVYAEAEFGQGKRISVESLRRTWIANALEAGMDPNDVADRAGLWGKNRTGHVKQYRRAS